MAEWKSKITDEQLELTVAECDPRKTGAGGWESVSKDSLWSLAYELLQHRRNAARADVQGEYICKCGVRVEPHRCATGTDF